MNLPDWPRYQQLAQKLVPGGQVQEIRPLSGGMSAHMTAFAVEEANGQRHTFIRRSYDGDNTAILQRESRLLQIIHTLGLAVPALHLLDLSGEIFTTPYLVMAHVAGQMWFAPTNLDDYLRQFAAHLARIHQSDYANLDLTFLPRIGACREWERREQPSSTHPNLREDQIRQTLSALPSPSPHHPATLLHGDYWPGNTLWHNGTLLAVIDWEEAAWGDPLFDLAQSRSELVWILGIEAMHQFTHHYQALMHLNTTHLPYWDLCAALRFARIFGDDLAAAGAYFVPFGRTDINAQHIQACYNHFVEQALTKIIT